MEVAPAPNFGNRAPTALNSLSTEIAAGSPFLAPLCPPRAMEIEVAHRGEDAASESSSIADLRRRHAVMKKKKAVAEARRRAAAAEAEAKAEA